MDKLLGPQASMFRAMALWHLRRRLDEKLGKTWKNLGIKRILLKLQGVAVCWHCSGVCVCEFVLIFLRSPKEFTVYDPGWLLFYRGHFLGFVFFWGSATLSKAGKFDFGETYPETDLRNRPLEFDCAR